MCFVRITRDEAKEMVASGGASRVRFGGRFRAFFLFSLLVRVRVRRSRARARVEIIWT